MSDRSHKSMRDRVKARRSGAGAAGAPCCEARGRARRRERRRAAGRGAEFEAVRARLNLHAVLPNLEDVVHHDPEMAELVKGHRITVQMVVRGGPDAWVRIADGACTVGKGDPPAVREAASGMAASPAEAVPGDVAADTGAAAAQAAAPNAATAQATAAYEGEARVVLYFVSLKHLNKMFDGKAQPIPLKGLKQLGFLKKEFTQLTDRLAYYLKPTEALLADPAYLALNTRLTLNTAANAVPILLDGDPDCRHLRHALSGGALGLKVLPDGPSVGLVLGPDRVLPVKGEVQSPTGLILLRDLETASAYLNGKLDTFVAAVRGEVQIWGQIGKSDALGLVLARVPKYLS